MIAGGGVGGLSAALALLAGGWEVQVFERAAEIGEAGAGLQISANGYRALSALGVAETVRARASAAEAIVMRRGRGGRRLAAVPLGAAAERRWRAPYLQVHRADLIAALQEALEGRAPGAVSTGAEAVGFRQEGAAAALRFADGREVEADLIVGADGLRSALRTSMLGPEAPRFTGYVAWRGLAPASSLGHAAPVVAAWAGTGRHAVTYPLRGGEMVNFVGVTAEANWRGEGWSEPGDPAALFAAYRGWAPELLDVISAIETPFRWALFDRTPLARWSEGRVVLTGDACHPMLPSLAQGACQALEDAISLAAHLDGAADIPAALNRHYAARIGRVSRVQAEARANLKRFHRDDAATAAAIRLAGLAAPGWFASRLDWLYAA